MISPIARLAALVGEEPVYIVGFDATHVLCVWGDGHIDYVDHREVRIRFPYDLEAEVWFQFGGNNGETATGPVDGVQPSGTQGEDADALPFTDGLSDSDVAEPPD